ncbi:transposase [Desulfomicrobium salsuginis]
MPYNSKIHRRRSIRLPNYDYSRPGAYFVTICVQGRSCLFGDVVGGEMRLNDAGVMLNRWYNELMRKFDDIACDAWGCMPNHVHFIVMNTGPVGADLRVRPALNTRPDMDGYVVSQKMGEHVGSPKTGEHVVSPLRRVVQWFKTMSSNEYIRGVKQHGWPRFFGRLWQRNYWEHIVRDEPELNRIREYIASNPVRWEMDRLHPGQELRETRAVYGIGHPADDADWMK